MRKKWYIIGAILLIVIAGVFWWDNRLTYEIDPQVSKIEEDPLEGIDLTISADRRGGKLQIKNSGEGYIVFDFSRVPVQFEVKKGDGWHRIISHKIWQEAPAAVSQQSAGGANVGYAVEFKWQEVVGGKLEPGEYRAIFYYGDGEVKEYEFFKQICMFEIK